MYADGPSIGPVVERRFAYRVRVVALAERLDTDSRAVRTVRPLRDPHGPWPVRLRLPGHQLTSVVALEDAHRVLEETLRPTGPPAPLPAATADPDNEH